MGIGLDDGKTLAKLWRMPRPKKDPFLVRREILRVPVSEDEKRRINAAVMAVGGEFAGWAREILLKAADDFAAKEARKKGPGRKLKETA